MVPALLILVIFLIVVCQFSKLKLLKFSLAPGIVSGLAGVHVLPVKTHSCSLS
jgi:hypothetical protein